MNGSPEQLAQRKDLIAEEFKYSAQIKLLRARQDILEKRMTKVIKQRRALEEEMVEVKIIPSGRSGKTKPKEVSQMTPEEIAKMLGPEGVAALVAQLEGDK